MIRRIWIGAVLALALPLAASPAAAAPVWAALGIAGGVQQPDGHLADYQWSTTPHGAFGAAARVGMGRWSAGLDGWTTTATQRLDATTASTVRSTRIELVTEARLTSLAGVDLFASLGAGRLHLGYDPDRVTIDTGGGATTVDLASISTWVGGGGLGLRRALAAGWLAGLAVDHRIYALDTAHREGGSIVERRETFGDWSARFELTRRFTR